MLNRTRAFACASASVAAVCWFATSRASAKADSESPSLHRVAVIGGGVCGLATALFLRQRGHKVTVLERDRVGSPYQASSINSGFLHNETAAIDWTDDALLTEPHDFNLGAVLNAGSIAIYERLQEQHGASIGFRRLPSMSVIRTDEQLTHSLHSYPRASDAANVLVTGAILDAAAARRAEPLLPQANDAFRGAVYYPRTATTNPRKTMLALKQLAESAGVHILEHAEVVGIRRTDGGEFIVSARPFRATSGACPASAHADDEATLEVRAHTLVLAAGGLIPFLASLLPGVEAGAQPCPVVPVVGQMFATAPDVGTSAKPRMQHLMSTVESQTFWAQHRTVPPFVTHMRTDSLEARAALASLPTATVPSSAAERAHIGGSWSHALTRHVYGKQCRDGRVIFGGDRRVHPAQAPDLAHALPRRIESMTSGCRAAACEILPHLAEAPVEREWSGIMTFSPDGAPLIGRVPDAAGRVFVVAGLNGSGFMKGAMSGKLLAALIDGDARAAELLRSADPARFAAARQL